MQPQLYLGDSRKELVGKLEALVIKQFEQRTKGLLILNENKYEISPLKRLMNTSIYGQYIKEAFTGCGVFRVLNCSTEEILCFKGRKLEVMCSSIKEIQVNVMGKEQVIEIFDSHIKVLKIIGARFNSLKKSLKNGFLYYQNDFVLICRNATIEKIESEELKPLS